MTEIKFRAWDKQEKNIINGFAHIGKNGRMYTSHTNEPENEYCVMQYTGLKDKNGKEIYEGDIVRTDIKMDRNFEVIFHQGVFGIITGDGGHCPLRNFTKTGSSESEIYIDVEVIGNISENPNLLNK